MRRCLVRVINLAILNMLIFVSANLASLSPFREAWRESIATAKVHIFKTNKLAFTAHAAKATISSISNGKKIKVNGIQFVKIGNNIFMATGKVNCTGTNVNNTILPNSSGLCTCTSGYYSTYTGTTTVANGGSCSYNH